MRFKIKNKPFLSCNNVQVFLIYFNGFVLPVETFLASPWLFMSGILIRNFRYR